MEHLIHLDFTESYATFLRAIFSKLKPWFDPKVSLPVGGHGHEVSGPQDGHFGSSEGSSAARFKHIQAIWAIYDMARPVAVAFSMP